MTAPEPTWGERLVRIETKLDAWLAAHQETSTRRDAQHDDHETRIRSLERARWVLVGVAAAGGGTVGAVLTKLIGA